MNLHEVQQRLEPLKLSKNHYLLFGSLPLLAHGLIQEVNDIDIWVDKVGWNKAKQLATPSVSSKGLEIIQIGNIEIYKEWMGMKIDEVMARAVTIQELPFANLKDVLYYKQQLNRPKDQNHIKLIRDYLKQN